MTGTQKAEPEPTPASFCQKTRWEACFLHWGTRHGPSQHHSPCLITATWAGRCLLCGQQVKLDTVAAGSSGPCVPPAASLPPSHPSPAPQPSSGSFRRRRRCFSSDGAAPGQGVPPSSPQASFPSDSKPAQQPSSLGSPVSTDPASSSDSGHPDPTTLTCSQLPFLFHISFVLSLYVCQGPGEEASENLVTWLPPPTEQTRPQGPPARSP